MSTQAAVFAFLFPGNAMINSLLATAYISIFPNLLLYFVPPDIDTSSLNTLVSFAVGGLLGDVFLHLLPHAFLGEHHEENVQIIYDEHKNVLVGLGIFAGLFFFFIMDKLMRVFAGGSGHDHSHSHAHKKDDDAHAHSNDVHHHDHSQLRARNTGKETKEDDTDKAVSINATEEPSIKLSAYLNLFADFTHNFTDGLAMAASFYASPSVGATTAVAVFFHEIPHEVGDYAILIQSGFSKQKAMIAQFTTAIGAFLGTIAGIAIEELTRSGSTVTEKLAVSHEGILGTDLGYGDLVIPFTAGGFMYIATVGVIPELLEVTKNVKKDFRQALSEFAAMLVGLGMMTFIAWNEASA
ncbi:Zinc/iron permease [Umbelopsis sp. PMI_123]|nr:Zinc/iron permease [Umbelopsis sp. PMI_123]